MIAGVIAGGRPYTAAGGGALPTIIGESYGGGYYAGDITYGSVTYAIIIGDISSEAVTNTACRWKTTNTTTPGTTSLDDGRANTLAMTTDVHPASAYCQSYSGGGFSDWYLCSTNEFGIVYKNLRPSGASTPSIFKTGGAQALDANNYYRSSTEFSSNYAYSRRCIDGYTDTGNYQKNSYSVHRVRPIRRVVRV